MHNAKDTATEQAPAAESTTRRWAVRLVVWFIGAFFVFSAVAKLLTLDSFQQYLFTENLAPSKLAAAWLARLLVAGELFIGLGFFQRTWFRRFFLPAAMLMLAGFSIYLFYAGYIQGQLSNCHCLGELMPMSPKASLVKNLVLFAGGAWVWWAGQPRGESQPYVPVVMGLVALLVVFAGFPVTPPQDVTVAKEGTAPPSPFAQFSDFNAGTVDLTQGTVVVVLVSPPCEHCQEVVAELAAAEPELPPVYLIALGQEEEYLEFSVRSQSQFPYLITDPGTFFDYIGRDPPRVYLLRDGQALSHWDTDTFSISTLQQALPDGGG